MTFQNMIKLGENLTAEQYKCDISLLSGQSGSASIGEDVLCVIERKLALFSNSSDQDPALLETQSMIWSAWSTIGHIALV